MTNSYFHCHAHSYYSCLDGMAPVEQMVEAVAEMGQPALALTDHGNMSGALALYKACRRLGIEPYPGIEAYLVSSVVDKTAKRYHIGLLALNLKGYRAICKLSTLSHQRSHFHYKPRFDWSELWELADDVGDDVAVLTGCVSGIVCQSLLEGNLLAARVYLQELAQHFPHLYVEIQHHGLDTDTQLAQQLWRLAQKESFPVIVTQDAHYVERGDQPAHDMMKRLVMQSKPDEDSTFNGDSFHLASGPWVRKHFTDAGLGHIWDAADDSYEDLLNLGRLSMPALDGYRFHVPEFSKNPDTFLKRAVSKGMGEKQLDLWVHYEQRVKYELKIIIDMGMANYFLLIADLVKWCKAQGIMVEARGSANGSLVCYVLGITQVDPIEWKLSFDRFLHPTRSKPPDIDLDIDRDRREEVVAYLASKNEIVPLGVYARLGIDAEGKGSIFVKYLSYLRRILSPDEFREQYAGIRTMFELEQIDPATCATLQNLASMRVRSSPGTHAAGFLLGSGKQRVSDYIPTMLIPSSNSTVTQVTMDDAEEAGYMKADLLGSATLHILSRCLELIGRDPRAGVEWIPLDDLPVLKLLRSGRPDTGIFQFEGYSTAKGGRQMGVKSVKDVILCMALYRTALMKSGHTQRYLARRKKQEPVTYVHDLFESVLKETYGVVVFQDQVIELLRKIDMRHEEINDLLKAVKQSNDRVVEATATFNRIRPIFGKLCLKAGMNQQQADEAWTQIMDFSEYGFAKAHATGYGIRAYRMAWLKAHHPVEFMVALLETWAGTQKEPVYVREARAMGVKLLSADVNISGPYWTIDRARNGIRRGITSIKGVGLNAAVELVAYQPYASIEEIIEATDARKVTGGKSWKSKGELSGVLAHLRDAGVLKSLEQSPQVHPAPEDARLANQNLPPSPDDAFPLPH